jgi:hypothetical protein
VTDDYDKEVSTAYEIGVKSEWLDRRLRVNAALFRNDVEDNQFFEFFAGPFGILRTVTTIDELYIQGLEADFTFVATETPDPLRRHRTHGFGDQGEPQPSALGATMCLRRRIPRATSVPS